MGRTSAGELSASTAAVLGLLIERPDTAVGVERRLRERLFAAQFAPTTSHSAIKSLEKQGYICSYVGGHGPARAASAKSESAPATPSRPDLRALGVPGLGQAADRDRGPEAYGELYYEGTQSGITSFWRWVRKSSCAPAIREELRTKIAFARPGDMPRLIEMLEDDEQECRAKYETLHREIAAFDEQVDAEAFRSGEDWATLTLVGLIRDEAAIWYSRMERHERLREWLESLRAESSRRAQEVRRSR
jgi:hypothetical protein